jgi:hypothetical protein
LDGKIKARTAVVLIVVVGVGITGASRNSPAGAFSDTPCESMFPEPARINAVFGAFFNRLDREAWRRLASAFRSHLYRSGAPRPMKMDTTRSPWRYD